MYFIQPENENSAFLWGEDIFSRKIAWKHAEVWGSVRSPEHEMWTRYRPSAVSVTWTEAAAVWWHARQDVRWINATPRNSIYSLVIDLLTVIGSASWVSVTSDGRWMSHQIHSFDALSSAAQSLTTRNWFNNWYQQRHN